MFSIVVGIVAVVIVVVIIKRHLSHNKVCPYWIGFVIDNPVRSWMTSGPIKRLVSPGSHVADVGCGHGVNTLLMASLVGPEGKVRAIDIQQEMLDRTRQRSKDRGLESRIEFVKCTASDPSLPTNELDFVLMSAVLHECPDHQMMLRAVFNSLKPGGRFLLAEPPVHVGARALALEAALACQVGFRDPTAVPMWLFNAISFVKPR